MQLEHTHAGEPAYLAYTGLKCRHPDCYAAFIEYRERLAERKLSDAFRDMRLKENRGEAMLAQVLDRLRQDPELLGQIIPVVPGVVVASAEASYPRLTEAVTDEAVEAQATADAPATSTDTSVAEIGAEGQGEAPREDQDAILKRLSFYKTPGGMVFDQALDTDLMIYMTGLSEERIYAATKSLRKAGKIRLDDDGHVWITGKAAA